MRLRASRRVAGGVIAAPCSGEVAGDCGGGAEPIIDVVLAGTERWHSFFSACAPRC